MTEQPEFDHFECPDCEFTSVQKSDFSGSESCPLCAEDCGHNVRMRRRTCRVEDTAEGFDARET